MLNLNKLTKTKLKPKPTLIFKNCTCVCVCIIGHNRRTQHSTETVLLIFPLTLQTTVIAKMTSTGGEGYAERHQ